MIKRISERSEEEREFYRILLQTTTNLPMLELALRLRLPILQNQAVNSLIIESRFHDYLCAALSGSAIGYAEPRELVRKAVEIATEAAAIVERELFLNIQDCGERILDATKTAKE